MSHKQQQLNLEDDSSSWAITQRAKVSSMQFKSKHEMETALRRQLHLVDQDTLLEQKRLELREVQALLDEKRRQYEALESKWREREEVLTKKKEHFLSRIGDMQIFTKKTSRKIEKYQQKADEERRLNSQKKKIIEQLNDQIIQLEAHKEAKQCTLKKIEPYQEFLNNMLNMEPSFLEVHKILQRYDTLRNANVELDGEARSNKAQQKKLSTECKQIGKEGQDLIFHLNAQLSKKQQCLENERSSLKEGENRLMQHQNAATKTNQSLGQIKMSINNLFDRCLYSRKNKIIGGSSKNSDILKKLEYINKRIEDITTICQQIKEKVEEEELP
uniref:DUF4200 domain-containing protein n=1 Tax=Percolomonas cosmopolitus TaxID=63605 RepID=A0A7S1KSH7_9EUKA|mmetsp:Transcript_5266/g.19706  ORF Transcript_5266/g.19706 Transcript_5266/m.19706 type:complete len:330 (+) Transcript_5266:134-1123(+)|eukprot:CAMPEP_0117449882 /NCGR_PEP_ID=MMETSP0759-20121206/8176_1 /TAXON_ID=63605 /ORGANISM="Percolomonas cosmopolitus, Strain WS" /LENGTH=329 /DNA_ID=CAMNT_0005242375 /DNA_START=72 /DNA_END=1061 /DNA_ORIENTATION=-